MAAFSDFWKVYDSILGDHSITPSVISLNDSAHFMNSTCISIENNSNKTKLFKLESIPSIGIEGKETVIKNQLM